MRETTKIGVDSVERNVCVPESGMVDSAERKGKNG